MCLVVSLVVQATLLLIAFCSPHIDRRGFLCSVCFFFTMVLFTSLINGALKQIPVLQCFSGGFIEEGLKVTCLLLFCSGLTTHRLSTVRFYHTEIWLLVLLIGGIENAFITLERLSPGPESSNLLLLLSFETYEMLMVLLTHGLRLMAHFCLTWLCVYLWRSEHYWYAAAIAGLHGIFNSVSPVIKSYAINSWTYTSLTTLWFAIFVAILVGIIWFTLARTPPGCEARRPVFSLSGNFVQ